MSVVKKNKKIRVSIKSKKALETHCKWCGKPFKKYHNRQMYCCDEHRKYARQEQQASYDRKYRKKYKHTFNENRKCGLGSGFLSLHANENFDKEMISIQNEKKRLGLQD